MKPLGSEPDNPGLEPVQEGPGILEKDGKWYMRLDSTSDGVEIPQEIGRLIKAALQSQVRRDSPGYNWVDEPHDDINCHQTIFFLLGLIDTSHPPGDYNVWLFADPEDSKIRSDQQSLAEFEKALNEKIGDELSVVQVGQRNIPHVCHTFLVGKDGKGRFTCFEKETYENGKFRITPFEEIFKKYQFDNVYEWHATPYKNLLPGASTHAKALENIQTYLANEEQKRRNAGNGPVIIGDV